MVYHISMARRIRKYIITLLIASAALSSLNAGRAFDVLHNHYRQALESGHIIRAISLYKPISMRLHDLRLELLEAHGNGDQAKIQELVEIIKSYDKYLVTAEEAERMGILRNNTNHPEKLKKASIFLYENTDFFRPTITIKDEYASDSQVHVWMAKPGNDIRFQHNYDTKMLDGRIFTGYRRSDGLFRKGEYPVFPMSYDSEVWEAIYEYGNVYHDPYYNYEIFYPLKENGKIDIPQLDWLSNDNYKLAGWKEKDGKKLLASQYDLEMDFNGRSMTLVPIWENIKLEELHLGNHRKNMKHGSKEHFFISLTNNSNNDILILVDASASDSLCITERVFEFMEMKEGDTVELGPYDIEALPVGNDDKADFVIKVKALESGNEWTFTPSISLK